MNTQRKRKRGGFEMLVEDTAQALGKTIKTRRDGFSFDLVATLLEAERITKKRLGK